MHALEQRKPLWPVMLAGAGSAAVILAGYTFYAGQSQSPTINAPEEVVAPRTVPDAPKAETPLVLSTKPAVDNARETAAQRAAEAPAASTDVGDNTSPEPDQHSMEEMRDKELAEWDQKLYAVSAQEVDPSWSPLANYAFEADGTQLGSEAGFSFVSTDCRTTHCAVVVQWPSYDQAVAGFSTMLHHVYQLNCARGTLLPEPSSGDNAAPYEMTMVFDCSASRNE